MDCTRGGGLRSAGGTIGDYWEKGVRHDFLSEDVTRELVPSADRIPFRLCIRKVSLHPQTIQIDNSNTQLVHENSASVSWMSQSF